MSCPVRVLCLMPLFAAPLVALAGEEEAEALGPSPSLDYLELTGYTYLEESEEGAVTPFRRDGEGAALAFGWQASDHVLLKGQLRATNSTPAYGQVDVERGDRQYEIGMAFVAPFGSALRVLIEMGVADEEVTTTAADGTEFTPDDASGPFGSIEFRTRCDWFEFDLRTAAYDFGGVRRQTHSTDIRFHVSENFALGAHAATWDRDSMRAQRIGVSAQFKF